MLSRVLTPAASQDFDEVLRVNLKGVFLVREARRGVRAARRCAPWASMLTRQAFVRRQARRLRGKWWRRTAHHQAAVAASSP